MKAKILTIMISFIFLLTIYSNISYAVTNEMINSDEIIEETEDDNIILEESKIENDVDIEQQMNEENLIMTATNEIEIFKEYRGAIYVDIPMNGQAFIRPDIQKITISGWAVSDDANADLRILLDGNITTSKTQRVKRVDVDSAISPGYGGVNVTPKAGFDSVVDISNLSAGRHVIRVEEVSRYGIIVASHEVSINIENKKYKGNLYVDTPMNGQAFIRPDVQKITISGWAVSDDANADLRILLDGNITTSKTQRVKRVDVDSAISPGYGGVNVTPKAGFDSVVDISNLSAGRHVIRVEEVSRYGIIVASHEVLINIENKKYKGNLYVDTPMNGQVFIRPDVQEITISGWAVSDDANADLRILLDGNVAASKTERVRRVDVDSAISPGYGGVNVTPKAGFDSVVDISSLSAGRHVIRVEEVSRYGIIVASHEVSINIENKKYKGNLYVDTPMNGQVFIRPDVQEITISGWAVSDDANADLRILLDGNVAASKTERVRRVDVDSAISPGYGGVNVTPKAGFDSVVDVSNLSAGKHTIKVEEVSRYGDFIYVFEISINIVNKKYAGEMCVDTPTFNQVYNAGVNMAIGGWAVAEDENATVEIYIDQVFKAKADRYWREDVTYFINKYGGKTIYSGFGKMIDTSGMSAGTHTLTVYEKSRYGDVIGGIEVKFIINSTNNNNTTTNSNSTTTTNSNHSVTSNTAGEKGIDVSQYQGTIDWKKVANSGVKYAMIRIGYRGYGTGGFAEDTKFRTNFADAVANGLKVGVYFYSTAINTTEAKQDAEYIISILKKYGYQNQVSMPIALDLELVSGVNTRDKNVSKSVRTSIANTFGNTIASYGYTPMIYACKSFLNDNMNASQILYDVWVAQYNSTCTYTGKYTMWQYTSTGRVSGISGNVDCNICYKNY